MAVGWTLPTDRASGGRVSPRAPPKLSVAWILLSALVMIAISVVVLSVCSDAFTSGGHVLDAFLDFGDTSEPLLGLAAFATCGLYLTDISYWSGAVGRLARRLSCLAMVCLVCILGISMARQMPYFPLALFMLMFPLAGLAIRITALRSHLPATSSLELGAAFLIAAIAVLLIWALWIAGVWSGSEQSWGTVRQHYSELAHCNDTDKYGDEPPTGFTVLDDGGVVCTAAFMLWVSPFILFCVLLVLGLVLLVLGRVLRRRGEDLSEVRMLGVTVAVTFIGMCMPPSAQTLEQHTDFARPVSDSRARAACRDRRERHHRRSGNAARQRGAGLLRGAARGRRDGRRRHHRVGRAGRALRRLRVQGAGGDAAERHHPRARARLRCDPVRALRGPLVPQPGGAQAGVPLRHVQAARRPRRRAPAAPDGGRMAVHGDRAPLGPRQAVHVHLLCAPAPPQLPSSRPKAARAWHSTEGFLPTQTSAPSSGSTSSSRRRPTSSSRARQRAERPALCRCDEPTSNIRGSRPHEACVCAMLTTARVCALVCAPQPSSPSSA